MPISVLSSVYTGNNQSGSAQLLGLSGTPRYNQISSSMMLNMSIYQALSSATMYSSSSADATLILFAPFLPFPPMPDYFGQFMQITNRRNSGSELDVDRFSDYGFNNIATSALVVAPNREAEVRLSFRDIFLERWRTVIDGELSGGARRDGDPTLTWEMWPSGISYLESSKMYLKVHQNLIIELHCWPDYDASITYHLYLYLSGTGRLRGYVARWAYWIEGGAKADEIEDQLAPAVISGMDTLNNELEAQLDAYSSINFSDLYYLPGDQVSRPATGVHTGYTTSDVTLVVTL